MKIPLVAARGVDVEEREELGILRTASREGVQTYHKQLLDLDDEFRVFNDSRCSEATLLVKEIAAFG